MARGHTRGDGRPARGREGLRVLRGLRTTFAATSVTGLLADQHARDRRRCRPGLPLRHPQGDRGQQSAQTGTLDRCRRRPCDASTGWLPPCITASTRTRPGRVFRGDGESTRRLASVHLTGTQDRQSRDPSPVERRARDRERGARDGARFLEIKLATRPARSQRRYMPAVAREAGPQAS